MRPTGDSTRPTQKAPGSTSSIWIAETSSPPSRRAGSAFLWTQRHTAFTRHGSEAYRSLVDGLTNTVVGGRGVPDPEFWVDVVPDPGLHRLYVTNIDQSRPTLVVLDDRDLSMLT